MTHQDNYKHLKTLSSGKHIDLKRALRDPVYTQAALDALCSDGDFEGCEPLKLGEDVDVTDAFVRSEGGSFYVIQGNNGRKLKRFSSKADADKHVERLHRKNKPSGAHRGESAKKLVQKQREKEDS